MIKMMVILAVLVSWNPFQQFGAVTPGWWSWMMDNKLYACMMTFFLCNAVETQLISTGAFEISMNDMPIWSKMDAGRIPQPNELFQIIDNQMGMRVGAIEGGDGQGRDFRHEEL